MSSFSEGAAEYLSNTNLKSMMEWMTAEVLFSRPEDPLVFIKNLAEKKLRARGESKYDPADNDAYLRECYEDPRLESARTGKEGADEYTDAVLTSRLEVLEKLIRASRVIAQELNPFEATKNIIAECCNIIEADRASLFRVDTERKEIELVVAEGAKRISLPIGKGIAGSVAETGDVINIPDAYADARFDAAHDKETGYRTTSILCAPVTDAMGRIVGVIQAINCKHGPFTELDVEILGILASQAGIALRNADLYTASVKSQEKVGAMLQIIKAMHGNLGINSLMFTITQRAHTIVDADRCTFFLANHATKELWSMQGEVDIRIPIDAGIAGAVATSGKLLNLADAYDYPGFNQEVDRKSGYRTKSVLCMPLVGIEGTVVGVIQLINKTTGVFDDEDVEVMGSFLTIAAPIVENSQLFQSRKGGGKGEGGGSEFTGPARPLRVVGSARSMTSGPVIEEGDEDEEED